MNNFNIICNGLILFILDKPEFASVSSPVEVMEGEPFVLNITASASPNKLDYSWMKGVEEIPRDSRADIWFNQGFLHLPKVSRDHAGTYTIIANNSEGEALTTVKLDVLFAPKYEI